MISADLSGLLTFGGAGVEMIMRLAGHGKIASW